MSTVCVIGLGYIGLPLAAVLASKGHNVVGVDVDEAVVASTNKGFAHFSEPGLSDLLAAAVAAGRLRAQASPVEADYYVIAVPTPLASGFRPDVSFVEAAARAIAPHVRAGSTVILESTSPVGTTERVAALIAGARPDLRLPKFRQAGDFDVRVAHCPERILPGQMLHELAANSRIVGGMTQACSDAAAALYRSFVAGDIQTTDCRTAECVKLVENSFRDLNIAFANELSMICARLGIDVWTAIELANSHPRVSILKPGAGVGGHCIAVDPWFLANSAPAESRLIRTAREVNDAKTSWVTAQILDNARRFKSPVVACFGVTYKPDVEDLSESPSLKIAQSVAREGVRVLVCDPMLRELPEELGGLAHVELASMEDARSAADIVALLVGHRQFQGLRHEHVQNKVVVDAIGLLKAAAFLEQNFRA